MGIAVLGPLEVDGHPNGLGPRDRVVLSALVVRAGDPVSTEGLADALWGERLPASWAKVVQGCVVRLRKRLGTAAIESGSFGYRLALSDDELDLRLFERALERAREALAGADPARASYVVREGLELWRGRALEDLDGWEPGRVEAQRLEGLRMDAEELLVEAETDAGRALSVLERARALVAQAPFRERRWALLATALYQAGRQQDALGAVKRARTMFVDELGLDPGPDLVRLEEQLLRQDPSLDVPAAREISSVCPYRGLLPYGAEHADSFFGREDDVAACLRRLRDSSVLAVVGPSGVGKSSLVRAGVAASLGRGGAAVLVITPGAHPLDSLTGLKPRGRQTLVVDQTEEAVTVCADVGERERFFAALAAHVGAGGALVLSLRADHLGDLAPYPDIARVLEEGLYLLGPMSEPDLRSAIEGPARRAGLRLEPGLVDLLVGEVEGEPAALPLLSHVLRETWEHREGPTLTVNGYRTTGGIRNAVAQSAETLYDSMDHAQRQRLRSLLLRLVMPTEDGEPVRARVPRTKVAGDDVRRQLVEQLVDARLVSIDGDTVQIAHEALVRVWPRLRGWLDDDLDGQRLFRHLAGAADAWDAMGRPDSELYRGARLNRVLEWRDRAAPDLNDTETEFLAASTGLSQTELLAAETRIARERSVNRRLRGALAGVGVLLVLTLAAGVVAVRTANQADRARALAEVSSGRAVDAAELAAVRRASAHAPLHEDLPTGLLLAVAALEFETSPQMWENLGAVLTRAGPLSGVRDLGESVGRPGTAWIAHMATSPEGGLMAATLAQEGVRLFSTPDLEPIQFPSYGPSPAVALSPDGTQLAVAEDGIEPVIRLYDLPGGVLSQRQVDGLPAGHIDYSSLDFSGDGTRIRAEVLGPEERGPADNLVGTAVVWDVARPSRPVFVERFPFRGSTALSPDGRRLYVAGADARSLREYDVDSGVLVRSAASAPVAVAGARSTELSPDGATIAVATGSQILLFDARTLKRTGPALRGHTARINDVSYAPNARLLVSASDDRSAMVWETTSGDPIHRFVGRDSLRNAAFGTDSRTVYATGGDGLILAWGVSGTSRLLTLGEGAVATGRQVYSESFPGPDGHTVVRVEAGRLWFEDAVTGASTRRVPTADTRFAWSPAARWFVSTGSHGVVTVWEAATGRVLARRTVLRPTEEVLVAFGPGANRVYVGSDAMLMTLDRKTLRPAYDDVVLDDTPTAILPHPADGSVIILMQQGRLLRVDPETGATLSSVPSGMLETEDGGALSPSRSLMAATDEHYNVRLLDLETLEWIGSDAHIPGDQLAYAPDGRQVAALQADRIRVWDGRSGDYQASLALPADLTADPSISYLPDSSGLLVTANDGRTWTVNTRTSTWVARACRIAGRNLTRAEWKQFFPGSPYRLTCPQWPADS
jgi:DNA-binding SARP family transcriptional activator/WD40 repeat protein